MWLLTCSNRFITFRPLLIKLTMIGLSKCTKINQSLLTYSSCVRTIRYDSICQASSILDVQPST